MKLTDPIALRSLAAEIEDERKRMQALWVSHKDTRHETIYLFRCRRLSKLRTNLILLAETFEEEL